MRSCVLLLAACSGNDLPGPGTCDLAADGMPVVTAVPLVGHSTGFDDLRYSPQLGKVVAVPEGTGKLFLVDPDTRDVTIAGAPGGSASADADAATIYIADRAGDRIVAIDAVTLVQRAEGALDANPDYVRVSPTTAEVWVTEPGRGRIAILDAGSLQAIDSVAIPGAPEGLVFDAGGHAYTQSGGHVIAIDVAARAVAGDFATGCGASHGFPQVDDDFGLVVAGCRDNGGAAVVSASGKSLAGVEAGGGEAILAYDGARHHLYLRGDPGGTLDIVGVCRGGGTTVLASVAIPDRGHGATADDRGHVWVCDATAGGLLQITDPFPAAE